MITHLSEVDILLVKGSEQLHEVVEIHFIGTIVHESSALQNLENLRFKVEILFFRESNVVKRAVSLVVGSEHLYDVILLEDTTHGLVLAREGETHETVPFHEVDGRGRVVRLEADDGGLDLGRGTEIVLANLHDMGGLAEELSVDGKTAVQGIVGFSDETKREFALEHENRLAEERTMRQKFKRQRRRNLIGSVCDADIKVRELSLDGISIDNLQLVLILGTSHSLLQFGNHARIDLNRNHLLRHRQQLHRQVTSTRTNLQNDITALQISLQSPEIGKRRRKEYKTKNASSKR